MKKYVYGLMALFLIIFVQDVNAQNMGCEFGNEYNAINYRESSYVNGTKINYYCEFSNLDDALNNFKEKHEIIISYIQNEFYLETLTENNWHEYYMIIRNEDLPFENAEIFMITAFFDIFENTAENRKIDELIKQYNEAKTSNESKMIFDKLKGIYSFSIENPVNNKYQVTPFSVQSFNVNAGVSYAEKYAWNPNSGKYGNLNPDDTNFASQILENGGYSQTTRQPWGWWYNSLGYLVDCSDSWRYANSFVRFFGLKNGYQRNFQIFSQNVSRGDFIAIDITGDGSYDRIGFVTYKTSDLKQYTISQNGNSTTAVFYDFIVAQHSNNYNSWVSEAANDWEYGILTRAKYALININ